jgi:hypothetical protein
VQRNIFNYAPALAIPGAGFEMLLLLACIAGVSLGLCFNVFVLLPVSLIGSAIFIFDNWSSGFSFYANIRDLLFPLVSVQAGYMVGLTGRGTYLHILARFHPVQSDRI